ncbi:hypothetical protein RPMA_07925 [Tardiphaga alba]|uniref:Cytochrome c domain-containing protein n=1 Tax=Tardiphaga alba TaxID=340268 RepID=A0ABX8A643_9BRAD|nr:hypothetical protein [Tardiphaga alba]QUS38766.1 hypothetical protein RPMA_07925 [Tardiphaga alba]
MRLRFRLLALLLCLVPCAAQAETGLAIMDPQVLRELEASRFGLAQLLAPAQPRPIANDALFALPAMSPISVALDDAVTRYVADHKGRSTQESIGIGAGHDALLFDKTLLTAGTTRFVLAGIVNRMDRAYVAPETCGEIRLIYRLTRTGQTDTPPRLPMTLNLVLHARTPNETITCADLARRWLDTTTSGMASAERLQGGSGPLAAMSAAQIDRIETNLQISHRPKSEATEFRTDYLQKVFHYDIAAKQFREAPMENQIDRDRLLSDAVLGREFRDWLLAPDNLRAFDRGTVVIPEKFLATASLAATPVGFAPSSLQPAFGLMGDGKGGGVFTERDVVTALARATAQGGALDNIRSPDGFARRLSDITCGGCHQIRGIGGFHFTGADTLATQVVQGAVPASPHFAGDQPRRRAIVMSIRDGKLPDFSRGFSDRPQKRGSAELAGTSLLNGWGATCYRRAARGPADASFASWTCADGLSCQAAGDANAQIGMCFVK